MLAIVRACLAVLALAVGAAFASVNFQPTTVDFFVTDLQAPLIIFIGVAFAVGALLGLLASGMRILRLREQLRRARQANRQTTEVRRPPAPKLR